MLWGFLKLSWENPRWSLYLEQQFETGDALEWQDQKGLKGQALADRVALQPL